MVLFAALWPCGLGATDWRVIDGRTVVDAAGTVFRLDGITADAGAAELRGELAGAIWTAAPTGVLDRAGHLPVLLLDEAGRSLQAALVRRGWARVWPGQDPAATAALLDLEDVARAAGEGAWGGGHFVVHEAVPPPDVEGFAIIRGRVLSTGETRRHYYLNFGRTYRTDMSVRIRRADARDWGWADRIEGFAGRLIEARGFVFASGGPMIELDAPDQLRGLD